MAYEDNDDSLFVRFYRCYPFTSIDKPHLENGDKIIMPLSALDSLASLHIDYPMLFELSNAFDKRVTHCGVLEFIADEGLIYLPYWMMQNMLLQDGDVVQVRSVSLMKGTYVKLQPHTQNFLDINNPKAILETTLRSYSCLTTGDTIMVSYNNRQYYIDVVETKPSPAVSIIETDCEVDFAPPLDYEEPEKAASSLCSDKMSSEVPEGPDRKIAKFIPFTGSARCLGDILAAQPASPSTSPMLKQHHPQADNGTSNSTSSSSSSHKRSGKLVFGSNVNQTAKEAPKVAVKTSVQEPAQKVEERKFQAFTGKKYRLSS